MPPGPPTRRSLRRPPPRHRKQRSPRLAIAAAALTGLPVLLGAAAANPSEAAPAARLSSAASVRCMSEQADFGQTRCDDVDPPVATLISAEPTRNSRGYLTEDHVSITFTGAYGDADADPIGYECQLTHGSGSMPWQSCTSPLTYTGLADSGATPYTFRVRAVDTADAAIDATAGGLFDAQPAATDLPDVQQTPASASFGVDSTAPSTFVTGQPFDSVTPDHPLVPASALTLDLASSEDGSSFECLLDDRATKCAGGRTTFADLTPGDHELDIAAVDPAGNTDQTPVRVPFSVPRNLTAGLGHGFTRQPDPRALGGDLLRATHAGAVLRIPVENATEVRVLAPTGSSLGTIRLQQGRHQHRTVVLAQATSSPGGPDTVVFQHFFNRTFTGVLTLTATRASTSRPAVVDALLAH